MINIIVGKKGTGKTKRLVDSANEAVGKSNGNVVVIEKGSGLTYDISHKARLIDIDSYGIRGADALGGFGQDITVLTAFIEKMNKLSSLADTKITLLISADQSTLPDGIKSVSTAV